jgi:hypothetical protein
MQWAIRIAANEWDAEHYALDELSFISVAEIFW